MELWEKFIELVTRHFQFLETRYGFRLHSVKWPFVTYNSDKLQVLIYFDCGDRCELDFGIRRLGDNPSEVSSIGPMELMQLANQNNAQQYRSPFAQTREILEAEVERLAELLNKYGVNILQNDAREFERIELLRKKAKWNSNPQLRGTNHSGL